MEKSEIKGGGAGRRAFKQWITCHYAFIIKQKSTTKLSSPVACTFEFNKPENQNNQTATGVDLLNPLPLRLANLPL